MHTSQRGFSTIELLIAFSVGIIFLTSAMMLALSDPRTMQKISFDGNTDVALDTILDSEALATSTNHIDSTLRDIAHNWNEVIKGFNSLFFISTVSVIDVSPCMKQVFSETSWTSSRNRTRGITFGSGIGSIPIAEAVGRGECDPDMQGDKAWTHPQNPNWQTTDGSIDGTLTSFDIVIINGTSYAFVATKNATQTNDLWVIDISNTTEPTVTGSVETGGSLHTTGLSDIDVVHTPTGTFAYVIQNSATDQLQTINVSEPTTLDTSAIESTISLDAYGVNPIGSNPEPKVLTYHDGRLYIGLHTTIGPEFLVFDVRSNPRHPAFLGALPNNFDHSINDIVIHDSYAYLAIAPGSSARATNELMILDISKNIPRNTNKGYNASSTNTDTEAATALYALGNTLYMGRERVSNILESDLYVFDVSSSTVPKRIKSQRLGISTGGGFGTPRVTDIEVHGGVGFVATTDSTKSLQVYDVLRDANTLIPFPEGCNAHIAVPRLAEIIYKDGLLFGGRSTSAGISVFNNNDASCAI